MSTGRETRLAEILAALSLACDLGNDFPLEKGLRNTLLGVHLAGKLALSSAEQTTVYYVGLLRFIGCAAYADETAHVFADDNAMRGALAAVDFKYPRDAMRQVAKLGTGRLGRVGAIAKLMTKGKRLGEGLHRADCEVMMRGASRMGLPASVARGLGDVAERWDGKGGPRGIAGEDIAVAARIIVVANEAELLHRLGGRTAACAMLERGAGGWFDPQIAQCFLDHADELLAPLSSPSVWDAVLDAEPGPTVQITAARVDEIARVFAELTDLKCAYTLGHSIGVADLAVAAAAKLGLADEEVTTLRRAGLLHDIGRLSVPTGIWNKPGPLSRAEWERVRMHSYQTERVLAHSPWLAPVAQLAAMHHERLDGAGYHRGAPAPQLSNAARLLAAADVYHALCEPRPHRAALAAEAAAAELQKMADAGALDREAARAVCEAAGHRVKKRTGGWPAGLSDREVEVLRHLARGRSEKEIASTLVISRGTVHTHVVHIYEKIGVSTRAGAALFAMEHDLLRA